MELTYVTTEFAGAVRHTEEQTAPFLPDEGREVQLINLYPQHTYQTFDGFGGAITESAAYIYSLMDQAQKAELMHTYFGRENMKYRFVRIPIDSCDFSLSHYEADGDEQDGEFRHFSFARMEQYILPMLDDAEQSYGGKLDIMLSPWSPPAYMKTNGKRNHGGKLKPCYRKRWAAYICRYIQEFRRRGYHVTMLTLQNEPKAVQTWDSCVYTAQEEKEFLFTDMILALMVHGLNDIAIYIWDHNKERAYEWAQTILDGETNPMVAGVAFHWYSGDHFESLRMIHERFPDQKLLLSEACIEFSKYAEDGDLSNAQKYAHDLIGNLNEGLSVFLDWNLVLDENGGPNHVQNYCDAPFLFHTDRKELIFRPLQSYLYHFSHFISPGAVRIGCSRYTDKLECSAFQDDNRIVFVLLNRTNEAVPAYIRLHDACAKITVAPNSIASGVIEN